MSDTTTLADWVSTGWQLGLFCGGCRAPLAALTGEDIMARFGDKLLATVEDFCARAKCSCGHVGAWHTGMADVAPEVAVSGVPGERVNNWVARDLYLRQLLAAHGRPLEVADAVWARIEAFGREHPDWEPRRAAMLGYPLSEAGARALSHLSRNGLA